MSATCEPNRKAENLKAQGNTLHGKGLFEQAYKKYTEAIKADPNNAILYANRAATCLALKEYMDAAHDAGKATQLDPKYAKAWARLGSACHALGSWTRSIDSWGKALACLPPNEDLKSAQKLLKTQFEAGLRAAEKAQADETQPDIIQFPNEPSILANMPWNKARVVERAMLDNGIFSSAPMILNAFRDFETGIEAMRKIKLQTLPSGKESWYGELNALDGISNGILRDKRVFHADSKFFEQFNLQVRFEAEYHNAWHNAGAKIVQEEALARLKASGWTPVRRALSVTIRAWVLRGFFETSGGSKLAGLTFYRQALDVLEWGHRVWKNIPIDDRGVIFKRTFARGIRRLWVTALIGCIGEHGCPHTLDDLPDIAMDMITETLENPPGPGDTVDAGFWLSFWATPVAEGLATLGWYHMRVALRLRSTDQEEANLRFTEAASYYLQAAEKYPLDEENHPYYLTIALEAYWWRGTPLRDTLPLCKRIRTTYEKAMKIWCLSGPASSRDPTIKQALEFERHCQKEILEGNLTLDDVERPSSMKSISEDEVTSDTKEQ